VRYVYESAEREESVTGGPTSSQSPDSPLLVGALSELPPELLDQLEQMTLRLNMEMIGETIEEIRRCNIPLANALEALSENFKYDRILALIQETRKEKHDD
jgi:hypothetical protein